MPRGFLKLSPEILTEICKGLTAADTRPRRFQVKANGLPPDTKFIRASLIVPANGADYIVMELESGHFPEPTAGELGTELESVVLETIYD